MLSSFPAVETHKGILWLAPCVFVEANEPTRLSAVFAGRGRVDDFVLV
jgi:hypothetical protein